MLNGCAYILTVDVGNTFIRFGLFAEDSAAAQECPLATCEITTPSSITADEARMRLVQVMPHWRPMRACRVRLCPQPQC